MLNIYAPINPLGYGIHSNNMIKAFVDKNIDINLTTIGSIKSESHFDKYWRPASDRRLTSFDKNSPSLFIFHDTQSNTYCGKPMMTFSVFETTKIIPASLRMLKNVADLVLTTTKAHKDILIEQGISEDKIEVVPEGIDPELYNYKPSKDTWLKTNKFTFITTGKCEVRKNTDMIVRTFVEEFQYKEAALICHTYNPFMEQRESNAIKRFTAINILGFGYKLIDDNDKGWKFSNGISDIYFTKPTLNTPEMKQLYHSANVGIQYSRGEGWDLPCHLPGTKIITHAGVKNIEDVSNTDTLLTHTGNFRPILKCMKKPNKHTIYNLKCFGNYSAISSTKDHPLYVIKKHRITNYCNVYDIDPEWVPIKDVKKGDLLIKAIPHETPVNTTIDLLDIDNTLQYNDTHVWYKTGFSTETKNSYTLLIKKYKTTKKILERAFSHIRNNTVPVKESRTRKIYDYMLQDNVYPKTPTKFKRFIDTTKISSLVGLYIAEGSKGHSKIVFTLHENEIQKCLPMIKNQNAHISNDNAIWTKPHKNSKAVDICVSGKIISQLMTYLCGSNSHTKRIPSQLLFGDIKTLTTAIDWCVFGDGCSYNNIVSYSTVSEILANEMATAFERLGYIPKISKSKRGCYTIYYTTDHTNNTNGIRLWNHKAGIAKLVKSNSVSSEYAGLVYNFEVAIDNSYTLCNGTTHNCNEMLACGVPCIASNCLGHSEYLNGAPRVQQELIIEPDKMIKADDGIWFKGEHGDWADMSQEALADKMTDVFDNSDKYLTPNIDLSRYYTTNYTWSQAVDVLMNIVQAFPG